MPSNPLEPVKQTVFETGPQQKFGITEAAPIQYSEDPTQLPQPINPAAAVDPGIAWYALGQSAFDTAGKLYKETLDYIIDGKNDDIQAIGFKLQDETNDLYQNFQEKLLAAKYAGKDISQEDAKLLAAGYASLKGKFNTEAAKILGQADFDRYTQEKPDLDSLGTKYRQLALQTRKSSYDIDNAVTQKQYEMAVAALDLTQKRSSTNSWRTGYRDHQKKGPILTDEEISAQVPFGSIRYGETPISENENLPILSDGSKFGHTVNGEVLLDDEKQPIVLQDPDSGAWFVNRNAKLSALTEEGITKLANQDALNSSPTDDDGIYIHPEFQKLMKKLVSGQLQAGERFYVFQMLRHIDATTIRNLGGDSGGTEFSANNAMQLSILHYASRIGSTMEQVDSIFRREGNNPGKGVEMIRALRKLSRGEDGLTYFNSDIGVDTSSMSVVINTVLDLMEPSAGVNSQGVQDNLKTYKMTGTPAYGEGYGDDFNSATKTKGYIFIEPDLDANDPNIVEFIEQNPSMVVLLARAWEAVENNPNIPKTPGAIREAAIREFLPTSFIPIEAKTGNFVFVDGRMISSVNAALFEADVYNSTQAITSIPNFSQEKKEDFQKLTLSQKRMLVAAASLRAQHNSGIISTDSPEVIYQKSETFLQQGNQLYDSEVGKVLLDSVGQIIVTRQGINSEQNGLSDGELLRIKFACDPRGYAALGLTKSFPGLSAASLDIVSEYNKLPIESKVLLAAKAWELIPSGEYLEYSFDLTNIDFIEGDNNGFPLALKAIKMKNADGEEIDLLKSFVSPHNLNADGSYVFRNSDNRATPLLVAGKLQRKDGKLQEDPHHNRLQDLRDIYASTSEGGRRNQATVLKDWQFPSANNKPYASSPVFIESFTPLSVARTKKNFNKYFTDNKVKNPTIRTYPELLAQMDLPENQEVIKVLIEKSPQLKGNLDGYSPLENFHKEIREKRTTEPGFLRTATDPLFTGAVVTTIFEKGNLLGFKTFSEYLALLFDVAIEYKENNSGTSVGYKQDKWQEVQKTLPVMYQPKAFFSGLPHTKAPLMFQRPLWKKHTPSVDGPDLIPYGSEKGLILWDPKSPRFSPILINLVREGYNIYTKNDTNEFYAFNRYKPEDKAPFTEASVISSGFTPYFVNQNKTSVFEDLSAVKTENLVQRFQGGGAVPTTDAPLLDNTVDVSTPVTQSDRQLVYPLGGWDGWGPRYEERQISPTTDVSPQAAQPVEVKAPKVTMDLSSLEEKLKKDFGHVYLSKLFRDTLKPKVDASSYGNVQDKPSLLQDIFNAPGEVWEKLRDDFPDDFRELMKFLREELPKIPGELYDEAKKFPMGFHDAVEDVVDELQLVPGDLAREFKKLPGQLWEALTELPGDFYEAGKKIVDVFRKDEPEPVVDLPKRELFFGDPVTGGVSTSLFRGTFGAALAWERWKENGPTSLLSITPLVPVAKSFLFNYFGWDDDIVGNMPLSQFVELTALAYKAPDSPVKQEVVASLEILREVKKEDQRVIQDSVEAPKQSPIKVPAHIIALLQKQDPLDYGIRNVMKKFSMEDVLKQENIVSDTLIAKERLADLLTPMGISIEDGRVVALKKTHGPDIEPANIVITSANFPPVFNNDGTVSTVRTISFSDENGQETLIPTIIDGKQVSEEEAIESYKQTGVHLGKFSSAEKATEYAEELHKSEERRIQEEEKLWFDLIKNYGGFSKYAYISASGALAIGGGIYSHLDGSIIKAGDVIPPEKEALYIKKKVYRMIIPLLEEKIGYWDMLKPSQQAALIAFTYSTESNIIDDPHYVTLKNALQSPLTWDQVPAALKLYNTEISPSSGRRVILHSLIQKREAEATMWEGN